MKTFLNNFMINMYVSGLIKGDSDMATFKTINKDYTIELERKEHKLWETDNSYKYLCKFIFKNNLGIPVFELLTSENDIFVLIDNIWQYSECNLPEVVVPINSANALMKSYNMKFTRNERVYNNSFLTISEYDPISQTMINRVVIEFDEDSLFEFTNLIYFMFLIDIDGGIGIYKSDMIEGNFY